MISLDQTRLLSALTYLVIAVFVGGNVVALRHRRRLRGAALFLYGATVLLALAAVAVWLGRNR